MSKGFTMVEALVAVVVLGLVVTASLKLVALSQRGLSQVRVTEEMIDEAAKMQIVLAVDPLKSFGTSEDISWNVEDKKEPLFEDEIDVSALGIDSELVSEDIEKMKGREQRWRELEVMKNDRSIVLFLPYSEEAAAARSKDIDEQIEDSESERNG